MTKISKIYMQTKEEDTDSTKDEDPTKGEDADLRLFFWIQIQLKMRIQNSRSNER